MKISLPLFSSGTPDEVLAYTRAESINFYPEIGPPGAREKTILRTAPGLTTFATLPGVSRGMRCVGEVLYAVHGETLSSVDAFGTATTLGAVLGGIRCVLTDGFIPDTSRQVIIGTSERGYVYDTVTGFAEITDANFVTRAVPTAPVYVGGYYVWPTADGILWSDISDPMVYPALNFRSAETVTDGVVTIALVFGDVWIFGTRSIEVVRLTGAAGADAFALAQTIDYGAAGPYAIAQADNGLFFVDAKRRVYRANGFTPQRVSGHQVEQFLTRQPFLDGTWMFSYVDRGHEFVGLTTPFGETHLYDCATQEWSRRQSFELSIWRVNTHALCYGYNLFGDYTNGSIWRLDQAALVEGADPLVRELFTGFVHADSDPLFVSTVDLVAEVGTSAQTGAIEATDPVIEMRYSDNGAHQWTNWKQKPLGKIGEYLTRVRWMRLGRTRQRIFHFRITDPVRADLIAVSLAGEKGDQA